ncbi:flippase [Nocardioides sp.]|uniref:flippase n=1 Tax=Nocardioides sp. TaxID=35761 RepID=UPI003567B8E9
MSLTFPPGSTSTTAGPTLRRDSGRTVLGTVVSTACNFAVIAVIARTLGHGAVGVYSIAFAVRAVLILVCGLGMRVALTKFVAAGRARGDYARVRGSILVGVLVPTVFSVVVAGVLALQADWLADEVFQSPDLRFALRMVALSLPFAVLMDTCLASTQGFQTMRAYTRIALVLEPVTRLVLTVVILNAGLGIDGALYALATASVVAGAAAVAALERLEAPLPGTHAELPWAGLLRFASVSWVASLATQGLLWADIVILGVLVSDADVGVYQVATRVVLAAMFVITPLTTAMAPRIAHLFEVGDRDRLTERYLSIVLWTWRLTLPLLVGILVVPEAALATFGSGFGPGVVVIQILAVGAVVEAVAAPSAVVLNQIGRNRLNMAINLVALTSNIALNFLLVPRFGLRGAAVAWALTMVVPGVVRVVAVRRLASDRWPLAQGHLVALLAALGAGLVARLLLPHVSQQWWAQLPIAGLVILVVYLLVVLPTGLNPEERTQAIRTLRSTKRGIATQFPALRGISNRWRARGLSPGAADLDLDQLISPFRYDVLARLELFELIASHRHLLDRDLPALVALARRTAYGVWFDAVLVEVLGLQQAGERERDRAFDQTVRRSVQLFRSVEKHGFHAHHPVSVAFVPAGVPVAGRRLAEDRWVPVDGCHRLALIYLSGRRQLESHEYVIDPLEECRYHTARLARTQRLDRVAFLQFLARGLVDPERRHRVGSWPDLLDQLANPANREALESWPEAQWLAESSGPDWYEVEERTESDPVVG